MAEYIYTMGEQASVSLDDIEWAMVPSQPDDVAMRELAPLASDYSEFNETSLLFDLKTCFSDINAYTIENNNNENVYNSEPVNNSEVTLPTLVNDIVFKDIFEGEDVKINIPFSDQELYESLPCPVPGYKVPNTANQLSTVVEVKTIHKTESVAASGVKSEKTSGVNDGRVKKPRRRKNYSPKAKMYQVDEPYSDEEMERKRLNAIKAHKNRLKTCDAMQKLQDENNKFRELVEEKDLILMDQQKIIQEMQQDKELKKNLLINMQGQIAILLKDI